MRRRAQFAALVNRQRARLRAIYAGEGPDDTKRRAKEAEFDTLQAEYDALKQTWVGGTNYDEWFSLPLNNAHIASITTYRQWLPGLRWLLDANGLEVFYAEVKPWAAWKWSSGANASRTGSTGPPQGRFRRVRMPRFLPPAEEYE